jgi:putative ABC transport system permease protein
MILHGALDSAAAALRYAARTLRRNPVFAGGAILTLALGIGADVAVFAFVNGLLLRQLPYPEPDRLVAIEDSLHGQDIASRQPG